MRRVAAAGLCSVITLTGCAGQMPAGERTSPPRVGTSPAVFATQLAGPSTFLAPMPTAVVLLKPDDCNCAFCQAFTNRLPTAQAAAIVRTAGGGVAGLIQGVVSGL